MNCNLVSRTHLAIASLTMATLIGIATLRPPTTASSKNSQMKLGQSSAKKPDLQEAFNKLPLVFEPNMGQANEAAHFIARANGADAFLGPTSAVFVLRSDARANHRPAAVAHKINSKQALSPSFNMQMRGGNPRASSTGLNELPGKTNYIQGNKSSAWLTGIPNYAKVQFSDVYPGIDIVYYGNQHQIEYDFILAPGADPSAIRLAFSGVESLRINAQGDLLIRVAGSEVVQKRPYIYQQVDGKKTEIQGVYALVDDKEVAFHVEGYDKKLALIIDPVLLYSTYLGGSGWDGASGIAIDASGSAYVVGTTNSVDLPIAHQVSGHAGSYDSFVAKLTPDGSGLVYSTYFGGTGDDFASGIAVDHSGSAYVIGTTNSMDFPVSKALQPKFGGGFYDAFIFKLNQNGSLGYSTYFGGSQEDDGISIAVDSAGNVYATGFTASTDFPTKKAMQPAYAGGAYDAFVAKIDASGSTLVYSTYLGGSQEDDGYSIAVDSSGNAYVTGATVSLDFPLVNAIQSKHGGGSYDGFVTKLNSAGSALVYSTFLGGSGVDSSFGIAVDSSGSAYVVGNTNSVNFPTTKGAFQTTENGGYDAFVTKISSSGSALVFSTYLGGSSDDFGNAIGVDASGNVYVAGSTNSSNFPTVSPLQAIGGGVDAFVAELNPSGAALPFSTYLGGSNDDSAYALAVDSSSNIHIAGTTDSANFPTVNPLQKGYAGGGSDAFIAAIGSRTPGISSIIPASGPIAGGTVVTINGTHFLPGASVSFAGVAASNVTVVSLATITATVPAHSAGSVDVVITNASGESASLAAAYTYMGPPSVSGVSPASGPIGGGTTITVAGSNFVAGATVTLDGLPATNVVVTNEAITAVTPAHAKGAVDLIVSNPDGQSGILTGGFSYVALDSYSLVLSPHISAIAPVSGPSAGGTTVTLTGANFAPGAQVTFDGTPVASVSVISSTSISVVTPAHDIGAVDVQVVNPNGQRAVLSTGFEFNALNSDSSVTDNNPGAMGCGCHTTGSAPSFVVLLTVLWLVQLKSRNHRNRKVA